jgi:hypothetical protein
MKVNITFKNGDQLVLTTSRMISMYPNVIDSEPPEIVIYSDNIDMEPDCFKLENVQRIGITGE